MMPVFILLEKMSNNKVHIINSITELHRRFSLPAPEHPLVSVIDLKDMRIKKGETDATGVAFNFYSVWLEDDVQGKIRYGQSYFDFDEGKMIFIAPKQVLSATDHQQTKKGYGLIFHPDFLRGYPLAKAIKNYGFFSYAVNEALFLSEKEEETIVSVMQTIMQEYSSNIDKYSQDVIVSHIEVLLNYSNRFYGRQFITRKNANIDLLAQTESLLTDYFRGKSLNKGLPTVQYLSEQLKVSPSYLSDMLRELTGQNAQQHIHNLLIEEAKELLSTTSLSTSEIAYQLGFEYPQSFSRLFKQKTSFSPSDFRNSFN
jgi:AraC family transcriptional regulator, transcriptional activator of pobA